MIYQMHLDTRWQDPVSLFRAKDTKTKVMNVFLHVADISNPTRPWTICREWAFRCLQEFFAQGDREKQLGLPVQILNDRATVNKAVSQINFIEFMIAPLEAAKVKLFPSLCEPTTFLKCNLEEWYRLWTEEDAPTDEELDKMKSRVARASDMLTQAMEGGIHFPYAANASVPEADMQQERSTRPPKIRLSNRRSGHTTA